MNILGIANGPDSGAVIIIGKNVIAAVNEERFSRMKLDRSFPSKSISFVLNEAGLGISDIDIVACGSWAKFNADFLPKILLRSSQSIEQNPLSKKIILDRIENSLTRDTESRKDTIKGIQKMGLSDKLLFVDHHKSHAYSAFYSSPFKESLVLTMDGRGCLRSLTMSIASNNEGIREIDWSSELDSLGYYYGIITAALGFTPHLHEGKITGLAAYGNPQKCIHIMQNMIGLDKNFNKIVSNIGKWYRPFFKPIPINLAKAIKNYKPSDIAAACQFWLEHIVCSYIKPFVKEYDIKNICLAGGVFGNVKLNQRIREIAGVKNVYVFPQMGDGGNALGAALYAMYKNKGEIKRPLTHLYLGPSYSNNEVEALLKKSKFTYQEIKDKHKIAAELIEERKIIGWFQGRMEYGPRALGNRSILAPADCKDVITKLNKRLHRSEFMPFAPATLFEKSKQNYIGWKKDHLSSNFMTMCYDCTDYMKDLTPAVVHVDGTARPQTVSKENNINFYQLVKNYYNNTGIPSIINTSFNNHEDPIVCSPIDALYSFSKGNVDVAVLGDFLIKKNDS